MNENFWNEVSFESEPVLFPLLIFVGSLQLRTGTYCTQAVRFFRWFRTALVRFCSYFVAKIKYVVLFANFLFILRYFNKVFSVVLANLIYFSLFNRFYVICKKIVYYPLIHYQPKWAQKAYLCLDFAVFPVKPLNIANWIVSILFTNSKLRNTDPSFHFDADADLTYLFHADPNSAHQSDTNLHPWSQYRPSTAHFEPSRLHWVSTAP